MARNARSRSALRLDLGELARPRRGAVAGRRLGDAKPQPAGPRIRCRTSSTARACACSRSANSGLGSRERDGEPGQLQRGGRRGAQRLAEEPALRPHLGDDRGPGRPRPLERAGICRSLRVTATAGPRPTGAPATASRRRGRPRLRFRSSGHVPLPARSGESGRRTGPPGRRPRAPAPAPGPRSGPASSSGAAGSPPTSRGFTLRRIAASLSARSRSMRSTSPASSCRAAPAALAQRLGDALGLVAELQHEQRPQRLARPAHELGQVGARVHQAVHEREDPLRPPLHDQRQHLGVQLVVHQPEHLAHPRGGDRALRRS